MHCPQCGLQQVSNELRFCSRCGFPLAGVAELMANGGIIPQYQPPSETPARKVSPRKRGMQQGMLLIFLATVLTPLFAVLNAYLNFPEIFTTLAAIIGFIGGAMRVIYALLFEEGAPKAPVYVNAGLPQQGLPLYSQPVPQALDANRARTLPPPQSTPTPVSNWRRPDTSELVRPPSVTENTTKLLDRREQEEPPAR